MKDWTRLGFAAGVELVGSLAVTFLSAGVTIALAYQGDPAWMLWVFATVFTLAAAKLLRRLAAPVPWDAIRGFAAAVRRFPSQVATTDEHVFLLWFTSAKAGVLRVPKEAMREAGDDLVEHTTTTVQADMFEVMGRYVSRSHTAIPVRQTGPRQFGFAKVGQPRGAARRLVFDVRTGVRLPSPGEMEELVGQLAAAWPGEDDPDLHFIK